MATFSNGKLLVDITSLNIVLFASSGGSTQVQSYTVPAGHFAEVSFILRTEWNFLGDEALLRLNGQTFAKTIGTGSSDFKLPQIIAETTVVSGTIIEIGVSIGQVGSAGFANATIKLYKNP